MRSYDVPDHGCPECREPLVHDPLCLFAILWLPRYRIGPTDG